MDWQQLIVIHVSDLHFGASHRFSPPAGDNGQPGPRIGIPSLSKSLLDDLRTGQFSDSSTLRNDGAPIRVIFALTGDFTETGSEAEYDEARDFLDALRGTKVFGWTVGSRDIFMVPGNHDVRYAPEHTVDRWAAYCRFYDGHVAATHYEHVALLATRNQAEPARPYPFDPSMPHLLSRIVDQSDDGLVVAEINSSAYVEKGKPGERRGEIDQLSISNLRDGMESISDTDARRKSLRIALIHHHPVLLPGLAEAGRGNDAIGYGEMLLNMIRDDEYHLVLHGHKHVPYTFLFDAELAWATERVRPIVIAAGGSAGSLGLASTDGAKNTYNIISLKWHPKAHRLRVRTETRGLVTKDEKRNRDLPAPKWHWRTLAIDDRVIARPLSTRSAVAPARPRNKTDDPFDKKRTAYITDCRRNFPAIEVLPTFVPNQGFEARVWIETQDKRGRDTPIRVEWSAGPMFPGVFVIDATTDPQFRARFSYYGPMVIQARLFWGDGSHSVAYIFAHYPRVDT